MAAAQVATHGEIPARSTGSQQGSGAAALQRMLSPRSDEAAHSEAEQDRLGTLQREAMIEFARSAGLPDMQAMMQAQAGRMEAEVAAAAGTSTSGTARGPDPNAAFSPREVEEWSARAERVIPRIIEFAREHHPELTITRDHFVLAFENCRLLNANAYTSGDGRLAISMGFVATAEEHPEIAIATVVHELHGHPEYDTHAGQTDEARARRNVGFALYRGARALLPAELQRPDGPVGASTARIYSYPETEMYAVLRQLPYEVATLRREANYNSAEVTIEMQLGTWREHLEPAIAAAMVHGFYRRLLATPEITPNATALFASVVTRLWEGDPLLARMLS